MFDRCLSPLVAILTAGAIAATVIVVETAAEENGPGAVTVVAYDFEDEQARTDPTVVDERVEAGLFMQPGFFPPPNRYFDGSIGGEAGEATVDRESPRYYDFTVEGLEAFERLDALSFTLTTRQSHAAAGHLVSVTMFRGEDETEHPLIFDVFEPANDEAEAAAKPAEAGVDAYFIGGHVGTRREIVVDLSEVDHADRHTFRIHFDRPRMRSRTAVDDVELTAVPKGY